jgi:hypothetical protein
MRPQPIFALSITSAQRDALTERFWSKVDRTGGPEACWPWTEATLYGYGVFRVGKRKVKAHRFAYVVTYGVEPVDTIDHLCHDASVCNPVQEADCPHRSCCNPRHGHDRSAPDNIRRGQIERAAVGRRVGTTRDRTNVPDTQCWAGHEFTDENTYVDGRGSRHCRACAVTRKTLSAHGSSWSQAGERVLCKKGLHPWDDDHTFIDSRGDRKCRDCDRARKAAWKDARRTAPNSTPPPEGHR